MELDSRDRVILRVLDANARSSLSEIAKVARLGKSAVARRIAELERAGYITGYYAVVDSSRLGYLSFRVYLKFNQASPKREAEIVDFLLREKRVWWLGKVQGKWDAGFVVWVRDLYDFRNFWLDFFSRFRQNVGAYAISPYTKLRHFTLAYLSEVPSVVREVGVVGEGPRIQIDEVDKKILTLVSVGGRRTIVELSRKTGFSPTVVAYRLKQLRRKGVIQSFRAGISAPKLGRSLYKLEFYLNDLSKLPELKAFAEQMPALVYIDETIGGGDFEAEFHLQSELELEELLNKFKARFHKAIRQTDYIVYSRVLKYAYYPEF